MSEHGSSILEEDLEGDYSVFSEWDDHRPLVSALQTLQNSGLKPAGLNVDYDVDYFALSVSLFAQHINTGTGIF